MSLLDSSALWEKCKRDSALGKLIEAQLLVWPEHEKFLKKSFESRSESLMENSYRAAEMIHQMITPRESECAKSYQWMCAAMNEEVMHFFRTGGYRFSSFAEVSDAVYKNSSYMAPYLEGLLLSQVFWMNHIRVIDDYLNSFLAGLPENSRFLDIGPGHGLFCALAAECPGVGELNAWDVSPSALKMTADNLKKLGLDSRIQMKIQDVTFRDEKGKVTQFDAIVLSEVLEHLENPKSVLKGIQKYLSPHGRVFINVPVNAPAIDHIYLLPSPEAARQMMEDSGFKVLEFRSFPATGYTEEVARKRQLTISCVGIVSNNPHKLA